jgi:hypothetical protein
MQSDDLDNILKRSAESSEPAFNEESWNKMEVLLDKHLPQKKRRRRALIILVTLLLIGISGYLVMRDRPSDQSIAIKQTKLPTPSGHNVSEVDREPKPARENLSGATEKSQTSVTTQPIEHGNNEVSRNDKPPAIITNIDANHQKKQAAQKKGLIPLKKDSGSGLRKEYKKAANTEISTAGQKENRSTKPAEQGDYMRQPVEGKAVIKDNAKPTGNNDDRLKNDKSDRTSAAKSGNPSDTAIASKKDNITPPHANDTTIAEAVPEPTVSKKARQKKGNGLAINFSLGPDISSVGVKRFGSVALQYGIGASYAINDKLVVRTGFYTVDKKYMASPGDYHPPAGYWTYYANLQKVEADCKVYEIPLSLLYNFKTRKDHNWFVSAGASSYIMKKEVYGYEYKNNAGQPAYYTRTIDNENKHLFSVLNISGGYRHIINKRLSVLAEPYVRLPLSGIGFGKVNLNSAGVLFTLSVSPFAKD